MKQPHVSIIILNWNGLEDTKRCLKSLREVWYENRAVYLIDNGSEGNEGQVLRELFPEVTLIENDKNEGFAGGNNIGIRKALEDGANYVLLLNNDTVVDPSFLSEMVKVAESRPQAGIIGPKVFFMERPDKLIHFGLFLDIATTKIVSDGFGGAGKDFTEIKEYDYVSGCCLLIKKEVIDKIGLLDERFFAYFEESDWCFRAKESGYLILGAPLAKIWHKVPYPPEDKRGAFQNYLVTRNRLLFTRKRMSRYRFIIYFVRTLPAYLLVPLAKSVKHTAWREVWAYVLGYCDFLRNDYTQKSLKFFT